MYTLKKTNAYVARWPPRPVGIWEVCAVHVVGGYLYM